MKSGRRSELGLGLVALGTGLVLAGACAWPRLARALEAERIARNRRQLAGFGLTPERYLATLDPTDYRRYAAAVRMFWPEA